MPIDIHQTLRFLAISAHIIQLWYGSLFEDFIGFRGEDLCISNGDFDFYSRLDADRSDLFHNLRWRDQIDETLVNFHLEPVPCLGTFTTRGLTCGDSQCLSINRYIKPQRGLLLHNTRMQLTLVGIRTGPLTFSCFSLAPLIRSAQTKNNSNNHFPHRRLSPVWVYYSIVKFHTPFSRLETFLLVSVILILWIGTCSAGALPSLPAGYMDIV